MTDDGRILKWEDLVGKNIKIKVTKIAPVYAGSVSLGFRKTNRSIPAGEVAGEYVELVRDVENIVYMCVVNGQDVLYFKSGELEYDDPYIRQQYFEGASADSGWFGGALDGDIAGKLSKTFGTSIEKATNILKIIGISFVGLSAFGIYLWYDSRKTTVNVNLQQ